MRPVRAFAVLSVTLAIWSAWRFDEAGRTYAAMLSQRPQAAAAQGRHTEPVQVARALPSFISTDAPALAGRLVARRAEPRSGPHAASIAFLDDPKPEVGASASARFTASAEADAFASADAAYRALAAGNRRAAANSFASALAADPMHPNAAAWKAELSALRKRWRMEAYSLIREGTSGLLGDRPLLGGGQSGARIGYTIDPLSRRPVEVFARAAIAHDRINGSERSMQTAIGAAWMPRGRQGPAISAERLLAAGGDARSAWSLRVSGGGWHTADDRMPFDLSAYVEAGVVGARSRDGFAGGQALALYPLTTEGRFRTGIGTGLWGSLQDSGNGSTSKLEIGPAAQLTRQLGTGTIELRGEYRFRIAGEAAPGSGPAVTIATRF
ncbi:hypothetical protein [Sphingosinicella soli]|uniref:Bacteriophage N4 adsorption protein A C-terminal domain-containing protein n=1 Tax=Sphingosinicella soli TaxID=333708 RepID=A0A7W7B1I2_9SPHN|nr:hypothetical protein [Sphingosinicella soli]MBB4631293.1 hypothetical protein [Sphingosinicella soli]